MKKILLLTLSFFLSSSIFVATAQDDPHWGVEGGLNISYLKGLNGNHLKGVIPDLHSSNAPFAGVFLGAFAEIEFTDFIGFRPGITLGQQGTTYSLGRQGAAMRYSAWTSVTNLNVPLLLTADFWEGRFKLFLGPQLGFAISCKDFAYYTFDKDKHIMRDTFKWEKGEYNVFDISLCVGLQIMFTDVLGLTARYNFGLIDFTKLLEGPNRNYVGQIGIVVRVQ